MLKLQSSHYWWDFNRCFSLSAWLNRGVISDERNLIAKIWISCIKNFQNYDVWKMLSWLYLQMKMLHAMHHKGLWIISPHVHFLLTSAFFESQAGSKFTGNIFNWWVLKRAFEGCDKYITHPKIATHSFGFGVSASLEYAINMWCWLTNR